MAQLPNWPNFYLFVCLFVCFYSLFLLNLCLVAGLFLLFLLFVLHFSFSLSLSLSALICKKCVWGGRNVAFMEAALPVSWLFLMVIVIAAEKKCS